MGTAVTNRSNAELIENARAVSSQVYHDELSQKIREAFAKLSFQEVENAISSCSAGNILLKLPLAIFLKRNISMISTISF